MSALSEFNERIGTTGAPAWGRRLALVLALGFYLRDLAHVLTALSADMPPRLWDHDITARSPVASLDEDIKSDAAARLLAVAFGVGCLWVSGQADRPLLYWFLVMNAMIPLADPVLFLVSRYNQ